jgi:hypothetical protein
MVSILVQLRDSGGRLFFLGVGGAQAIAAMQVIIFARSWELKLMHRLIMFPS